MKNGVVKFYNEAKGFGFIKEDNGPEIFVHATGLQEEIRENDNVVFDVQEGKKEKQNFMNIYKIYVSFLLFH